MDLPVPPVHWTYRPIEPNLNDLQQGDIIQPSDQLRSVFKEVHKHFIDEKYIAFLILTQTCDMVRWNNEPCRSRYINIAVIRPLADILPTLIDRICGKIIIGGQSMAGIYTTDTKNKAEQLLERIFNQNAQAEGLFYLHPDAAVGISEPSVAVLQVSVSLRSHEHYDELINSRTGRMAEQFQSRLGWLIGNLFSRVATRDWERNLIKEMASEFLGSEDIHGCSFSWVPRLKAKEAESQITQPNTLSTSQIIELIKKQKGRPKEIAIEVVLEAIKKILPDVSPDKIKDLETYLASNSVFDMVCRAK